MSATAAVHHGDHHDDSIPDDEHFGAATPGKIGMWMLLLSDAFSFFGLLLAYGICRGQTEDWYPAYLPQLGINFTAGMTFLLICSSVTMVLSHAACADGDRKKTLLFLGLTILGGVLFLAGQVYEYYHLIHEGMIFGDPLVGESRYASTFYMVTSFHGAHVFTGVTYLTVMWINTARGKYDGGKHNSLEVAGLFWHFVDLVWILVFTFVYLVPE
jgi:heme/copper-type cytochrome/quinol oxidase subunit 3